MEQRPNAYDGLSYYLKDPAEIELLDPQAAILLEPGQIEFFNDYPNSLKNLLKEAAKLTEIPEFAKWLASLWNAPLVLEVHTTSSLYNLNAVWLRFLVRDVDEAEDLEAWHPGINLLGFKNPNGLKAPALLMQVLAATGEINHNGYAVAGRLHHPDLVHDEAKFFETLTNDQVFYQIPGLEIFWEFHGGYYESEEERRQFGLYHFTDGLPEFLNLYFKNLRQQKEIRIDREGNVISKN